MTVCPILNAPLGPDAPIRCAKAGAQTMLRVNTTYHLAERPIKIKTQLTGSTQRGLIFTDLDGSLLDHHTYSAKPASDLFSALDNLAIPVIPVTSKTAAEVIPFCDEHHNNHPFVVENGAALYIPKNYFREPPRHGVVKGDYICLENSRPRHTALEILARVGQKYEGEYDHFKQIYARDGARGIARITGLSESSSAAANCREYSEPVIWYGSHSRKQDFIKDIQKQGGHALQGGRFITLGDHCDKGMAIGQLNQLYREHFASQTVSLAIGDSANDVAMLERADWALLISNPGKSLPQLQRSDQVLTGRGHGPAAWQHGVCQWLTCLGLEPTESTPKTISASQNTTQPAHSGITTNG